MTLYRKYKLPLHQNGHVYLTSHRICYVDNTEARKNSIAIDLRDVGHYDFYAGFLKSSAKITISPKPSKHLSGLVSQVDRLEFSTPRGSPSPGPGNWISPIPIRVPSKPSVTWICSICSFSNLLSPSFDINTANQNTVLQPCQTCGIKPTLAHVLKAAISATAQRPAPDFQQSSVVLNKSHDPSLTQIKEASFQCPRCTFSNHPSLLTCEMCGAPLIASNQNVEMPSIRPLSPGPVLERLESLSSVEHEKIKLSFRAGGAQIFYERLKGAITQRKWLLTNAPPIPTPVSETDSNKSGKSTPGPESEAVGIAGLELLSNERRKNNATVINSAFSDLEALIASAQDIIALAESLSKKTQGSSAKAILNESVASLGMSATKDMLGSDALYLSELSRTLAEYLTDDRAGVLKNEGGIMTLVDLWARFNRKRNGVELVRPSDFEKAARRWVPLGLPVRLREFKNGLLVVQRHDWTDSKIVGQLLAWFQEFRIFEPVQPVPWDWRLFGRGVSAQEAANHFGWSLGVAIEELEMAEDKGVLCREETPEGIKFWENWLGGNEDKLL